MSSLLGPKNVHGVFPEGTRLFVAQSCDQYCIQLLPYIGHTLTVCMIISMWTIVYHTG